MLTIIEMLFDQLTCDVIEYIYREWCMNRGQLRLQQALSNASTLDAFRSTTNSWVIWLRSLQGLTYHENTHGNFPPMEWCEVAHIPTRLTGFDITTDQYPWLTTCATNLTLIAIFVTPVPSFPSVTNIIVNNRYPYLRGRWPFVYRLELCCNNYISLQDWPALRILILHGEGEHSIDDWSTSQLQALHVHFHCRCDPPDIPLPTVTTVSVTGGLWWKWVREMQAPWLTTLKWQYFWIPNNVCFPKVVTIETNSEYLPSNWHMFPHVQEIVLYDIIVPLPNQSWPPTLRRVRWRPPRYIDATKLNLQATAALLPRGIKMFLHDCVYVSEPLIPPPSSVPGLS